MRVAGALAFSVVFLLSPTVLADDPLDRVETKEKRDDCPKDDPNFICACPGDALTYITKYDVFAALDECVLIDLRDL